MAGVGAGLLAILLLVSTAWTGEMVEDPAWTFWVLAAGVLVGGWLLGLIFVRTVGLFSLGLMAGALLAAVILAFKGEWAHAAPMAVTGFAAWLVQMGQSYRTRAAGMQPGR